MSENVRRFWCLLFVFVDRLANLLRLVLAREVHHAATHNHDCVHACKSNEATTRTFLPLWRGLCAAVASDEPHVCERRCNNSATRKRKRPPPLPLGSSAQPARRRALGGLPANTPRVQSRCKAQGQPRPSDFKNAETRGGERPDGVWQQQAVFCARPNLVALRAALRRRQRARCTSTRQQGEASPFSEKGRSAAMPRRASLAKCRASHTLQRPTQRHLRRCESLTKPAAEKASAEGRTCFGEGEPETVRSRRKNRAV